MQVSDKKIWILEDSLESRTVFEEILELRYGIKCFENLLSFDAYWQAAAYRPDLVMADLRLPDGNFLNYIQTQLQQKRDFPPFIVISSVDDLDIMRAAFKYGALDYLVKPFKKSELLVKIEHLLKKNIKWGNDLADVVTIDPIRMLIKKKDGAPVKLTAKELQIFAMIYESENRQASRADLFKKIWQVQPVSEKTLDVHISNLRQKVIDIGLDISFISPCIYRVIPLHERV
jgi:DNA-binding response OmpR family regulator